MTRVSVIVPCRNERAHIAAFCAGVLRQHLPPGTTLQLLIADGRSDDGTRETLQALATADPRITPLDNPRRTAASGLNTALAMADGDVIVRMDVHTTYADDYVAQCLAVLARTGADNVGGAWQAVPPAGAGPMQRAIAASFQSRWVAGGARSRQLDFSGEVDTVYLGCWPRATFARHGGFDESLVRNQDDEHNLRIRLGGGRIWQSAAIRSAYRPRATLVQVYSQWLQYGYWKPFVMKKHGQAASLRQLVPGVFLAVLMLALAGSVATVLPLIGLVWAYGLVVVAMTLAVARSASLGAAGVACVPAVIAAYHLGYGLGSLAGWLDVLRGAPGRPSFGRLTR